MPIVHVIEPGESVSLLAARHGLFDRTIWDDPANAELRARREHMNVLLPGDRVVIPDRRPRTEPCATGRRHVFRRRGVPSRYRLQVLDAGRPVADARFRLVVDGVLHEGRTDTEGVLDVTIPPASRRGALRVDRPAGRRPLLYRLYFGHLDPITSPTGVVQRLRNLGHLPPALTEVSPGALEQGMRRFQAQQRLAPTGRIDAPTLDALRTMHDTRALPNTATPPGTSGGQP